MVSIVEQNYNMMQRPDSNEDFTLYPEPPQSYQGMDLGISPDGFGMSRNNQDMFPASMTYDAMGLYADPPNYMFNGRSSPYAEEGEARLPSSNLSTASAPSAASSAVGSPQSNHGQLAPIPEWGHPTIAVTPSIVGHGDYFHTGTEYYSSAPGMEEFAAYDLTSTKPPGFVGELSKDVISVPRLRHRLHHSSSISSSVSLDSARTLHGVLAEEPALDPGLKGLASPSSASSAKSSLSFASPVSGSFSSPPATAQQWSSPSPHTPRVSPFFSQSSGHFIAPLGSSYPSLIHPDITRPMGMPFENGFPAPAYPNSPSTSSSPQPFARNGSQSPFQFNGGNFQQSYSPFPQPMEANTRRMSYPSNYSGDNGQYSGDESSKERQRCPHADCGKTFKDLKAHLLTHQNERPEKCPIVSCEYHVKGFSRKYDKNRHTLTHYKGTMVCGFCPGSGSAAEKSFNRADVFKRHLTAVHGVEQTPPNSRKKTGSSLSSKKLPGYPPDATGKCSTCTQTFSNAQDFYEHLDDCVLRIVQQEDPAEGINAQRLAEVENDREVHHTLEKNHLPLTTEMTSTEEADEDDEMVEEDSADEDATKSKLGASPTKKKGNPANGVQKSRGMTHSRGGVPVATKTRGRKSRRDYPSSWGFDKGQMTMKKRVMAVFEGPRRLAKDDMMLSTEHEVRLKLSDGKSYVTDLDVQTLKRAQGFLDATEEEKGPWLSDDPTEEDMKKMQELLEGPTGE